MATAMKKPVKKAGKTMPKAFVNQMKKQYPNGATVTPAKKSMKKGKC
jgi:hypothetical protein